MNLLKIYNPIRADEEKAFFSISDWNFKLKDNGTGQLKVRVYSGDKILGEGIVDIKDWKKTAWEKVKKVELRPEEPLVYYFNQMYFQSPDELERLKAYEYNLI